MTHELIVDSVVVRFGEKTVVSGGYVTARTGSVTGLLGRNGAGKSCMFRALMGGLKVDYVSVHADGKPVDIGKIGFNFIRWISGPLSCSSRSIPGSTMPGFGRCPGERRDWQNCTWS